MIGVILAGGNGTRIAGHHDCASKVLITIEGRTLIESNMLRIVDYVDSFVVVVGKARDQIIAKLGHIFCGKPITYVTQPEQNGPLDALKCATKAFVDEDIILVLGDEFLVGDNIKSCAEIFNRRYPSVLLGIIPDSKEEDIAQTYSIEYSSSGNVRQVVEKPKKFPNKDRGTGYYFISSDVLRFIGCVEPRENGQYELADFFNLAVNGGYKIKSHRIAEKAYNVNTVEVLHELVG